MNRETHSKNGSTHSTSSCCNVQECGVSLTHDVEAGYDEGLDVLDVIEEPTQQSYAQQADNFLSNLENFVAELKEITSKPFKGRDASEVSDNEIFREIAKLEKEIEDLQNIKAKSVKLEAHIGKLQTEVGTLVAYVDNR